MITCECSDEEHCPNRTCLARDGAPCFRFDEITYDEIDRRNHIDSIYGCFQSPSHGGNFLQCKGHLVPHASLKDVQCCYGQNMCNADLPLRIGAAAAGSPATLIKHHFGFHETMIALTVLLCLIVVAGSIASYFFQRRKSCRNCYQPAPDDTSTSTIILNGSPPFINDQNAEGRLGGHTLAAEGFLSDGTTSDSKVYMDQRTISREVDILEEIGRGRFGRVHLGHWRGERVAVKIFSMADQFSFDRERAIYEIVLLRHENILGYINSDLKSSPDSVSPILVTEYCEWGSLHKFLSKTDIEIDEAICLVRTAAAGIDYLHNSLFGSDNKAKPAIAHRDIKSNNILVKPNFVCVIADFGLAVKFENGKVNFAPNVREGTARYMPPELLSLLNRESKAADKLSFDMYKQGDMYSFSLVMWEVLNRCRLDNWSSDYKLPFEGMVDHDPRVGQMFEVVVRDERRPPIAQAWLENAKTHDMLRLICECWSQAPEARLTSRYVKTRLTELSQPMLSAARRRFVDV